MFIFIVLNLCMGFLLFEESVIRTVLLSDISMYVGIALMLLNLIAINVKVVKIPFKLGYDLFASGSALVWFAYWPAYFRAGSPLFYYYPLYFTFMTALFSLVFIAKRENMDIDTIMALQWLSNSEWFNPAIIMTLVMLGLYFTQHFLLFPVAVTLLIIRFALASCVEKE